MSPLRRARETCDIAGYWDRAVVDPDLVEWDYGDYDGLTGNEIRERRPGWTLFRDGVLGGETIDEVAARAQRVIARVRPIDGDVLLFGHGHQLRILTALWLEFPAAAAQHLQLATASPSMLGYEHEWTALLSWNGLLERLKRAVQLAGGMAALGAGGVVTRPVFVQSAAMVRGERAPGRSPRAPVAAESRARRGVADI